MDVLIAPNPKYVILVCGGDGNLAIWQSEYLSILFPFDATSIPYFCSYVLYRLYLVGYTYICSGLWSD